MIIGIDLALRNSACVVLDKDGKYIDSIILTSDKRVYDNENLLIYNYLQISNFIKAYPISIVYIEGLSFNSPSGTRDIIAGNMWYLKTRLQVDLDLSCNVIVPTSWRAKTFSAEQKEELKVYKKANNSYGTMLKDMALRNVPDDVKVIFKNYLTNNKLAGKFIYDLADAYNIAKCGVIANYDIK